MTAVKKISPDANKRYKQAAADLRAKLAVTNVPLASEVLPVAGIIRISLSGTPIPRDRQQELFGPSVIDIPEMHRARKRPG